MKIGNRPVKNVIKAIFQKRHYAALKRSFKVYRKPFQNLFRYIFNKGEYPYSIWINTPIGKIAPKLYSPEDLVTAHNIFGREDYYANAKTQVVVDIGSNIGLSALYFLTRNHESKVYLYEPYLKNVAKLRQHLFLFESRYKLTAIAVADYSGRCRFKVDETGTNCHITNEYHDRTYSVPCKHINEVLEEVLKVEKRINILKINIDRIGTQLIEALDRSLIDKIDQIYVKEEDSTSKLSLPGFQETRYGDIFIFKNMTSNWRQNIITLTPN